MEPRKRTHLVNGLMDGAQLMMTALEKAAAPLQPWLRGAGKNAF